MDLLDTLLGGRGCSTDGSLTRNPITSMVDSVFNSHVAVGQNGQVPSLADEQGFYMEQPTFQAGQAPGWQESYSGSEVGSGFNSVSLATPFVTALLNTSGLDLILLSVLCRSFSSKCWDG